MSGNIEKTGDLFADSGSINVKKDIDCERGDELLKKIKAGDQSIITMSELQDIIIMKIPICASVIGYHKYVDVKAMAQDVLIFLNRQIKQRDDVKFSFTYLCSIVRRLIYKQLCESFEISENQYYMVILVKRVSEKYNIPINEYNAYKFSRLIEHDQPKALPNSTKVLKAIEYIKNAKIGSFLGTRDEMDDYDDTEELFMSLTLKK